jgi:phosphoglycolate phosphatase-like HAD superfamily hydrolase
MQMNIERYTTLVFDCDGVILNSNKIKTEAFYETTKSFGHDFAQALVDYHIQNGGVSRYAKFEYFFHKILNQQVDQLALDNLLLQFTEIVKQELATCEVAEGLAELKHQNKDAKWLVVSGGDQTELREVFVTKNLAQCNLNIIMPALFLGDSKYDYQAAKSAGLDFVFISEWSEAVNWEELCETNMLYQVARLSDFIA